MPWPHTWSSHLIHLPVSHSPAVLPASRQRRGGVVSEPWELFPTEGGGRDDLFSVDLKNQPGELAHLGDIFGQRGINLQLAGVVTGDRGTVLFTASDEAAARTALEGAGIEFTERAALQVKCADQPGEAAKFGHKLANAGVNMEGLLEVSICQGEVIFAIAVDKPDEARTALGDQVVG